ncbi:unnamed protein product [Ostreobium quekettii]|uniref:Dienelactone hydrolase domain-containing protein n=1 Tax=Ostreobium quekettii TaxID=121088 RepID=A0A8S1IZ13_9CHLO|nr:unnamed protein product [Ostreobium quekettii]|eukprot:evm.model.scf_374.3 EVM.evm.TU.scf_374.3   scf_374:25610-35142(+)
MDCAATMRLSTTCLLLALVSAAVGQDSPFTENVNLENIQEQAVPYEYKTHSKEGTLVWDTSFDGSRPVVAVFHDADGPDGFELWVAQRLANEGYAAFVADLWGGESAKNDDTSMETVEEKGMGVEALIAVASIDAVKGLNSTVVDPDSVIVVGYGFGGTVALELARSGSDVPAVAAIHPTTLAPAGPGGASFGGRVLVVVGDGQEGIATDDVISFHDELRGLGAAWEVTRLSKVAEGFTLPTSDNFDAVAEMRAWQSLSEWLQQVVEPSRVDYLAEPYNATGVDDALLTSTTIDYSEGDFQLRGFASYLTSTEEKRPVLLIVPDGNGIGPYELWRAKLAAMEGYVGFVADIYGADIVQGAIPMEERVRLITGLFMPRTNFLGRMSAALAAVASEELSAVADATRVVAIGYCFGGSGVIELMRAEPEGLLGIASFHGGILDTNGTKAGECNNVATAVYNGADDPTVSNEEKEAFRVEMNAAKVNWELTDYGGAVHRFTNPDAPAGDPNNAYDPTADFRSWESMKAFLAALFSDDNPYVACP